MLKVLEITDYYKMIGRYFREYDLGSKYDDPNLENIETYKKIIHQLILDKDTDFMNNINIIFKTNKPLINELIDYVKFFNDPILYKIINSIQVPFEDNYIIKMDLGIIRDILIYLLYRDIQDTSLLNDFISIITYFPKEFFEDLNQFNYMNDIKFSKFKSYIDPVYEDNRSDVFFITDLKKLDESITMYPNKLHVFLYKLLTINFTLKLKIEEYSEFTRNVFLETNSHIRIINIDKNAGIVTFFITCDLFTLRQLLKQWKKDASYNNYSIAFMYWCLKDFKNLSKMLKVDDEEDLYNCLINGNALSRRD